MKKKYRNITVDGIEYAWTAKYDGDGDGGVSITIWKDEKPIFNEHYTNGLFRSIMPSTIEHIIKNLNGPKLVVCPFKSKCDDSLDALEDDMSTEMLARVTVHREDCACGHSDAHLYYDKCKNVGCVSIEEGLKA